MSMLVFGCIHRVANGVLKGLPVSSTRLELGILEDSQCTSKHMNKIGTVLLHTKDDAKF